MFTIIYKKDDNRNFFLTSYLRLTIILTNLVINIVFRKYSRVKIVEVKNSNTKSKKVELILNAAQDLFPKHGIKRVSVEEICRKAKVSKMTFYKYFSNKIELLRSIWEGWIDEGIKVLDEIDAQDMPLPDKIQTMFEWKSDFMSRLGDEFIEDILELKLSYERSIKRFLEFINNAQKRGEIRESIRPEFLMTVLEKLYNLGNDEHLRSIYPDFIEFNREIKDFFWYGIMERDDFRGEE